MDPLLENPPKHTLGSRLQDWMHFALYYLLRRAPIDMISDLGSRFVRWSVPRNRPWIIEGARNNLRRLRPDLDEAAIETAIQRFLDNVGRLMAEFVALHRLYGAGRIMISERCTSFVKTAKEQATVAIVLHTGNWEVCGAALHQHRIPLSTFAIPPETWAQRVIASKARKALGIRILYPDTRGLRDARRELRQGRIVSIFCDEARGGFTVGPFFGRQPHREGNLGVAAWLARDIDARLIVFHCRRLDKSRFFLDATDFFQLPQDSGDPRTRAVRDAAFLNGVIEPIVLANLDQWYFLDNTID